MPNVHVELASEFEPDAVWSVIGDFYAVHLWCPLAAESVRDPSMPNARLVTVPTGASVSEELLDETARSHQYQVHLTSGPMSNYRATLAVHPGRDGRGSLIVWDATFDCDEALATEQRSAIEKNYRYGLTRVPGMAMAKANYKVAQAFFHAVTAGQLPDELLTEDMSAWTTTGGTIEKAGYQQAIRMLAAMCATPPRFTIHSLTADEDRVAVEADSSAVLINGEEYRNTYVFVFRVRDGRIASVAEHYNAFITEQKLMPLVPAAAAKVSRT
jgi:ketosteroid isomerase-like protein